MGDSRVIRLQNNQATPQGGKMKRSIWLIFLCCFLVSSSYSAELVGYWKFDEGSGETAWDSADGHPGEIHNAVWTEGKIKGALEFDGKGSYVEVKDSANSCFDLTSMTLSAWIYPKAYPESTPVYWAGIVGKGYYTCSVYGLYLGAHKKLVFSVYGPFGEGGKVGKFTYGENNNSVIKLNQWSHVVVTYDNYKVKFYINGRLDSVYEETRLPYTNDQSVFIGSVYKDGRYFKGIIDEVKIYRGALTDQEVEEEYQKSGGENTPQSVSIPKIDVPPQIDGNLNDLCWQQARKVDLTENMTGGPVRCPTTCYICYDDNNIYFGFLCKEPYIDKIKADEKYRDGKVWEDDCVEVFIDTNLDRKSYYHFSLNTLNTQADEKWIDPLCEETGWDGFWDGKTVKGQDFWSAEIAIPFYNFSFSQEASSTWGINLCRERKVEPEYSAWAPTFGGFHKPEMFATVKNINIDFPLYQINPSSSSLTYKLGQTGPGLVFSQKLKNCSHESRKIDVRMKCLTTKQEFKETVSLLANEDKELNFPISLNEKDTKYKFQLDIFDIISNKRCHLSAKEVKMPSLVSSYFTRDYYTDEKNAKLKNKINIEGILPFGLTASLKVVKGDKTITETTNIPISEADFSVEINIDNLPPGEYMALLSVYQKESVISLSAIPLIKYTPSIYEIKSDRENLWTLVNNTPFFAIGIMDIPQDKISEYARAGFNITVGPESPEFLDTAYYNGMMVIVSTYQHSAPRDFFSTKPLDELERIIREGSLIPKIKMCKNHPAFFGYFWDEPGEKEAAGVSVEYRITKEYDPYHLVFPCFWEPSGPPIPSDRYDILDTDPYWQPRLGEKITRHVERVDTYWKVANTIRKPFWVTPQADGWSQESKITSSQQRCQTYLDLIHEARGIVYWEYNIASQDMKETLKKLAGEIKELTPILLTSSPSQAVSGKEKTGIDLLLKLHNEKAYIITANISEDTKKNVQIKLSNIDTNTQGKVLFEKRTVSIVNGAFKDNFEPYATHVYEIGVLSELPDKPIEVNIELLSLEKVPTKEEKTWTKNLDRLPGIKNPGFEEEDSGQPVYWASNLCWEYPEYCSLDSNEHLEGKKSLRMFVSKTTIFSPDTGYGWTKEASSFDLGSKNELLRYGHRFSGIFKVSLDNGEYTVIATMRSPNDISELENGAKHPLKVEEKDIPEIKELFPEYENRIKEYTFGVKIEDGSLDLQTISDGIFGLRIIPKDEEKEEIKFIFTPETAQTKKGYKKVIAPKFPNISVWTEEGAPPVNGGRDYVLSVHLKSDISDLPVRLKVLDYNWRKHPNPTNKIVNVGPEWKEYTFQTRMHPEQDRARVYIITEGKAGTLWIDKVEVKELDQP